MYTDEVSEAHLALVQAKPSMSDVLDELDIDLVTVGAGSPTAQVLTLHPGWRVLYTDADWAMLCRRQAPLSGALGAC